MTTLQCQFFVTRVHPSSLAELLRLDLFGAAVAEKPTYGR